MTMTADPGGQVLYGEWRRRRGTKTDAHLWAEKRRGDTVLVRGLGSRDRPRCERRIPYDDTAAVRKGRPCTDCLVAEITRRDR